MIGVEHDVVVDALRELAHQELQEQLWSGGGGLVSSLEEAEARLFDDSGLAHALERSGTGYGAHVEARLHELARALRRVDAAVPVQQLLEDPRLARVRALAVALLSELEALNDDGARP